jgi:hypothetical protein
MRARMCGGCVVLWEGVTSPQPPPLGGKRKRRGGVGIVSFPFGTRSSCMHNSASPTSTTTLPDLRTFEHVL